MFQLPGGPKGEKRPADVIGNVVQVMRIAAGEIEDIIPDDGKDPAAKALGKKGGFGSCERQFRRREPTEPKRRQPFP